MGIRHGTAVGLLDLPSLRLFTVTGQDATSFLHNRTTNQAVAVNLINPPLPMGAGTFRIVNIEPYARLVHLSDNTVWQIDSQDFNFPYWKIGQRVLIGVNNNWRTASFPHILINVDMYKEPYSQGIFYGYPVGY